MRETTGEPPRHIQLTSTMVISAALGALLLVLLTLPTARLLEAATQLDLAVLEFLSRFARRSWLLDTVIWSIWNQAILQYGVVMVVVWRVWFADGETPASWQKRQDVFSTLVALYPCVALVLMTRAVLPFRPRPVMDPTVAFRVPFVPPDVTFTPESTSFPSGHAAVLAAFAIGLWSISRRLGIFTALYGAFVVCLPRLYFGRHFATDILAGTAIAVATVPLTKQLVASGSFVRRLPSWSARHSAAFYTFFFFCCLDIATDFGYVKTVLHLVGSMQVTRIVGSWR
jgi:undecaprenyl-diphosphatase